MHSCLLAVDDINERRLQARAANKEAINIRLLRKFAGVLLRYTSTVQNARLLRSLGRDFLLQPLADGGVDFLCLLGGGDLAGADSPGYMLVV